MELILSDVKVLFKCNFTQMRKLKHCTFIQWPPLTMINPNLVQCFVMSTSTLCVAKTQHISWNTDYTRFPLLLPQNAGVGVICCCFAVLIVNVNVSPQLLHGLAALSLSCPHALQCAIVTSSHAHTKQALNFSLR